MRFWYIMTIILVHSWGSSNQGDWLLLDQQTQGMLFDWGEQRGPGMDDDG